MISTFYMHTSRRLLISGPWTIYFSCVNSYYINRLSQLRVGSNENWIVWQGRVPILFEQQVDKTIVIIFINININITSRDFDRRQKEWYRSCLAHNTWYKWNFRHSFQLENIKIPMCVTSMKLTLLRE